MLCIPTTPFIEGWASLWEEGPRITTDASAIFDIPLVVKVMVGRSYFGPLTPSGVTTSLASSKATVVLPDVVGIIIPMGGV